MIDFGSFLTGIGIGWLLCLAFAAYCGLLDTELERSRVQMNGREEHQVPETNTNSDHPVRK